MKIAALMMEYTALEWLAYLQGSKDDEEILVTDIFVPPHAIQTSTSAEAVPFHQPANCVGIIHSHHSMGAFHSGTDAAYVDGNYPVSIVVAFSRDQNGGLAFNALTRLSTPCKRHMVKEIPVNFVQPRPNFDLKEFLDRAKEAIQYYKHPHPLIVDKNPTIHDIRKELASSSEVQKAASDRMRIAREALGTPRLPDTPNPTRELTKKEKKKLDKAKPEPFIHKTVVTDGSGRVLSRSEVEALMRDRS